jgi:hypothetical protein
MLSNRFVTSREFEMMKFSKPLYPESATVNLVLYVDNSEQQRYEIFLKLRDSCLSCMINDSLTIACDYEENNFMVSFRDKSERFVSERVVVCELGTRASFALALKQTPHSSSDSFCSQLLDVICDFSKCLNLYFEPTANFW